MRSFFLIAAFANGALAQAGAWAQCGGHGWTGSTTCVAGYTCKSYNAYYAQCIPGAASSSATTLSTTTTGAITTAPATSSTSSPGTTSKFKWLGVDESIAEFGSAYPGTWGKDFYFPDTSTIQTLINEGYNIFRVPFMMERMVPDSLTGAFGADYLKNYTAVINYITTAGAYAVLDPHNYGRYKGNIINDTSAFQTFWFNFAGQYKSNGKVIFDTNNEYNTMAQTLVFNLNQAAIDGIRAAGATSQYIFAEGNQWTGAWTWTSVNTNLVNLTDPQNKLVYEMHQYFNADGSSSETCVSATIGSERLASATAWLRQNSKVAFLGEFSGYPNSVCLAAVADMLKYMHANSDVWLGGAWWAAGPWWGTAEYSFEPPSGVAYQYYGSTLRQYVP